MAKVTITISDQDGDQNLNVSITFDPPVHGDDLMTPAQEYAIELLGKVQEDRNG